MSAQLPSVNRSALIASAPSRPYNPQQVAPTPGTRLGIYEVTAKIGERRDGRTRSPLTLDVASVRSALHTSNPVRARTGRTGAKTRVLRAAAETRHDVDRFG
jgi:hypothetical protein